MRTYNDELFFLGCKIRDVRESKGLSREDVADKLDMSVSTIYRVEIGKRPLTAVELFGFAELFKIPVSKLMPDKLESYASLEAVSSSFGQLNDHNVDFERRKNELLYIHGTAASGTKRRRCGPGIRRFQSLCI